MWVWTDGWLTVAGLNLSPCCGLLHKHQKTAFSSTAKTEGQYQNLQLNGSPTTVLLLQDYLRWWSSSVCYLHSRRLLCSIFRIHKHLTLRPIDFPLPERVGSTQWKHMLKCIREKRSQLSPATLQVSTSLTSQPRNASSHPSLRGETLPSQARHEEVHLSKL